MPDTSHPGSLNWIADEIDELETDEKVDEELERLKARLDGVADKDAGDTGKGAENETH